LQDCFKLRGLAPYFEDGTALDAPDIECAAAAEFGVFPGDVDSTVRQEPGETWAKNDGGNLRATKTKLCFFAAITETIRSDEEAPNVPIRIVFLDPW
jgi:hypothetical protein